MRSKRTFDVVMSLFGLLICSPLFLIVAIAIKLESRGPVFYRPTRVGRDAVTFRLVKFRSMRTDDPINSSRITVANDLRVTRVGRMLRTTKIDELPQLLNVIRGEMSLVGPRPEDPAYVAGYTPGQRRILGARPGLTSQASLAFRNEQELLGGPDAESTYIQKILPAKLRMDLEYHWTRTFVRDLKIISDTIWSLALENPVLAALRRHLPWFAIDFPVALCAFTLAYYVRFLDTATPYALGTLRLFLPSLVPFALAYVLVNLATRLDRRVWRYATAAEVVAIGRNCLLATAVLVGLDLVLTPGASRLVPLSAVLSGGFMTFAGFVVVRYRWRLLAGSWHRRRLAGQRPAWAARTLIVGAGEAGQLLAWRLLHLSEGQGFSVVGFIDDDPTKRGRSIHGISVLGGRNEIPRIAQTNAIELIAVAIANIRGEDMRAILSLAQETQAKIKIVPDVFDWMSESHEPLREVHVEDLLGRKPAAVDSGVSRQGISGKRVLVTGAAGSIGTALCHQIGQLEPSQLVGLDNNESGLFDLAVDLRSDAGGLSLDIVVADVTNADRVREIFDQYRPQVIFHVAAYKHVPLMELYPREAARVNVLGTWIMLNAARTQGADRFVLVSTDKAVNPSSIMGATKRIAEMLVSSDVSLAHQTSGPVCTAVRFGNVLGSRGSVVPTFNRQIDAGGPVTITDPQMTRYFMDVQEAASLIIQAAQMTTGQDIFMLEMGDQIRVDDLARKMIRLRGLRPGVDIPIEYVGVRPGEKLQEELSSTVEDRIATWNPLIYRLTRNSHPTRPEAETMVATIRDLVGAGSNDEIKAFVRDLAGAPAHRQIAPQHPGNEAMAKAAGKRQMRGPAVGLMESVSPPPSG